MPYHTEKSPAKKSTGKLSEKQKADLKKHMDRHKDKMSPSEVKRHRMQMLVRIRRGMTISQAHKEITS